MSILNTNLRSLCDLSTVPNPIGAHIASYVEDCENKSILFHCVQEQSFFACKNMLHTIQFIENDLDYEDILIMACHHNDTSLMLMLLDHISSPDSMYKPLQRLDNARMNILCYASLYGNLEICKELIDYYNCSIEGYETHNEEWDYDGEELIRTWYGNLGTTPLVNAVYSGNLQLVRYLLKKGAKVDNWANWAFHISHIKHGELTPLGMAVLQNKFKIAKLLLTFGADPDIFYEKNIYHEFYVETKVSASPLSLVLDDLNNRIRFLKLFKKYTNVITHEQYITIRNKLRANNKIQVTYFKALNHQKKKINRFRITEIIKTIV